MSEKLTLRRKLFLAGQDAQAVAKNGHSDADGGFDFTRAVDVVEEAARVLEGQGILVIPEVESEKLRFGKTGCLATVAMNFEVCDSEGEESFTRKWVGSGWDFPGHKAVYAAITGSEKYFLAKLLKIPFGIDPEEDAALSSEADKVRARQDGAAEAPDVPPALQSVPAPTPAPSVEDEMPADTEGLS